MMPEEFRLRLKEMKGNIAKRPRKIQCVELENRLSSFVNSTFTA
jgi:hypothetical protein